MKLLVVTQKINKDDPILGFFHNWVMKLAERFESVMVICLEKGQYRLPPNVKVLSLGKENLTVDDLHLTSKVKYIFRFYRYIWKFKKDYDSVFVHMNQEYVLFGSLFWKILGKKIFMWRNHPSGNFLTKITVWFSDKVLCTSKFAFVAKYKKTVLMPVGIDTSKFVKLESSKIHKIKDSILFLSRISPIKRPDLLIEALGTLNNKGLDFICNLYGDPLPKDENYYNSLKKRIEKLNLVKKVIFHKGIPNYQTPEIYSKHDIFVNLTPSGSFDKTILEAAACGCLLVIANISLSGDIDERMIIKEEKAEKIAENISFWLKVGEEEKNKAKEKLARYVSENHSLDVLLEKLTRLFNQNA